MRFSGFSPKEAVEIALRVLVAWTAWQQPVRDDVVTLKRAFPEWNHLSDDELACRVINALREAVFLDGHADGCQAVQDVA
jgi:hypothetical protein